MRSGGQRTTERPKIAISKRELSSPGRCKIKHQSFFSGWCFAGWPKEKVCHPVHNNLFPYVLSVLSLFNLLFVWRGRRGIIGGNWLKHRNLMVVSLFLWGLTLGLFAWFLWSSRLWVLIGMQPLFLLYVALALLTSSMLVATLWRVAKHRLLPHKILARKTFIVWQLASFTGMVLYTLIGFSFMM
jgi:uncharacterized membrane protein YozB (DUF420 family)